MDTPSVLLRILEQKTIGPHCAQSKQCQATTSQSWLVATRSSLLRERHGVTDDFLLLAWSFRGISSGIMLSHWRCRGCQPHTFRKKPGHRAQTCYMFVLPFTVIGVTLTYAFVCAGPSLTPHNEHLITCSPHDPGDFLSVLMSFYGP